MNRFDQLSKEWDNHPRRTKQAENIFKAIEQKVGLTDSMHVLDIGTGTGLLLIHFVDKVKTITGIDNSQGMLDMLKSKVDNAGIQNTDFLLFNADTDRLPEEVYDLAVSSLTFHHLSDPLKVLEETYKSLKPGGRICIGDLEAEDGTFHDDNAAHDVKFLGFDKAIFNEWLIRVGFQNTSVETAYTIEKNGNKYPVFLGYGEKR
jgi:ubiquinone/menaquinone biosynthesis C-methylase UbiE